MAIDWKSYYRSEFNLPRVKERLEEVFAHAEADTALGPPISRGAILSFPHTALRYAGPLQARVIVELHQAKVRRVIALGVFHVWGHEISAKTYSLAMDEMEEVAQRVAAFEELKGAFVLPVAVHETPFGSIYLAHPSLSFSAALRKDTKGHLANEFSLDTFMILLSFYYRSQGEDPPVVTPLYIGMTRDPVSGSFAVASQVAELVRRLVTPRTAVVATGDLVHYGTAYTPKEMMDGMPKEYEAVTKYFRGQVEHALWLSLVKRAHPEAFWLCDKLLNNDQRYLLPVITEFSRSPADYVIVEFKLSDYTGILKVNAPCVVASALVAYIPGEKREKR